MPFNYIKLGQSMHLHYGRCSSMLCLLRTVRLMLCAAFAE